jgi:hypothetical protein
MKEMSHARTTVSQSILLEQLVYGGGVGEVTVNCFHCVVYKLLWFSRYAEVQDKVIKHLTVFNTWDYSHTDMLCNK